MSKTMLEDWHAHAVETVRQDARKVALHLMHDHPVIGEVKRKQGMFNIRKRNRFHLLPRLWHRKKVYTYYLELYHPLWLGEDGVIYREYQDLFGNAYFMEAEIWLRDFEGLRRVQLAVRRLDPCVFSITL